MALAYFELVVTTAERRQQRNRRYFEECSKKKKRAKQALKQESRRFLGSLPMRLRERLMKAREVTSDRNRCGALNASGDGASSNSYPMRPTDPARPYTSASLSTASSFGQPINTGRK